MAAAESSGFPVTSRLSSHVYGAVTSAFWSAITVFVPGSRTVRASLIFRWTTSADAVDTLVNSARTASRTAVPVTRCKPRRLISQLLRACGELLRSRAGTTAEPRAAGRRCFVIWPLVTRDTTGAGVLRNARQPIASYRFLSILMTTPSHDRQNGPRRSRIPGPPVSAATLECASTVERLLNLDQ